MLPLFALLRRIAEPISFLPPFFSPPQISLFWENSIAITAFMTQIILPTPVGRKSFNWVIFSDLLLLNNSDIPTLFYRSSASRSSTGIFFALFSLFLSCSWKVLQDLGSDHVPILLTVPLSPFFRPNERPPSFDFEKARWDDFGFFLTLTVLLKRNTRIFLFSLLLFFFYFSSTECSPYDLVLWTDGFVPLFFGKGGSGYLPTALSVALRPPFSF